jgi:HAD superfamily hydrolase (TIGR01509 family)
MNERMILWDNDGVLVDSEELYYEANRAVLADAGISLSEDTFRDISLRRGQSVLDLAAGVSDEALRKMRLDRNARYAALLAARVEPRAGMAALLARWHGIARMAVVTASLRQHFEVIHRRTGFARYFDFTVTFDDVPFSKPHPDPYLEAVRRAGGNAAVCLAVEDSERGVAAAIGAGVRCVAFPSALTRGGQFSGAARVVETAEELDEFLRRWTAGD